MNDLFWIDIYIRTKDIFVYSDQVFGTLIIEMIDVRWFGILIYQKIIIPNYNQQDATFLDLFISTDALHVSGGSSAHHQEYITVLTASGIVNQYCSLLLSWMRWKSVSSNSSTIAASSSVCSWWCAEEHLTVHTASGIVNQYCCLLLSWMRWNSMSSNSSIIAASSSMCSWWWAEEPPVSCRARVEINKSRNVAFYWL